jgi:enamine deaminase RidA (YjgF/YER057c/UK114 family)
MMNTITTNAAPKAIGPYCQAISHDGLAYCSGQTPLDPKIMKVVERAIGGHAPAHSTVQIARLPLNVMVEIECIATLA